MRVLLFGIAREIVGKREIVVDSADTVSTVAQLKNWINQEYPRMQQLKTFAVAVDNEYAEDAQTVSVQNEIAIIPPVSGG